LVTAGVSVAALGAGIGLVVAAKSKYAESSPFCDADNFCDPPGLEARDAAFGRATGATVAFVIVGVAAGGALTLWFTAPRGEPARVGFRVVPAGVATRIDW
jgi:hypothetical protein